MNYHQIYDRLISKSRERILIGYGENHHILPKCMGGTNEKSNITKLTTEEHFLAHQLLVKICPDIKGLVYACVIMCNGHEKRATNKLYGWIRREYSKSLTGRTLSEETKQKMPIARKGRKHTEDRKKNISAAVIISTSIPEVKQKMILVQVGKKLSDKTKQRISSGHIGKKKTLNHAAAISAGRQGIKFSPEYRAAISLV